MSRGSIRKALDRKPSKEYLVENNKVPTSRVEDKYEMGNFPYVW